MHWIILGIVALALVAISVRYPRLAFTILIALLGGAVPVSYTHLTLPTILRV